MTETLQPRLWLRILTPNGGRIGPGMIRLLKAVEANGSITGAAKSTGMSYRRAWLLLEQASAALGVPAVETSIGGREKGGARLTQAGARLVALYERLEAGANANAAPELEAFFGTVAV